MASEIRVNKLNSQTGVGTITLSPTGVDISGVTTVSTLRSNIGIFSGTVTGEHHGDGSNLTGVASTENIRTNTNATFLQNINVSGTSTVAGTSTANLFSGSGASLTNLPAANLTGALPAISAASLTAIPAANIVGLATAGFSRSGGFPSGDFVKLQEATGSDLGAALIFDNLDTSTYRAFKLYFALLPNSTADGYYAYFRFRTGGASGADDTSSHYSYTYSYGYQNDGSNTIARIDGGFGGLTHTVGGQATVEGMRGVLDIVLCRSGDGFNTGGGGSGASGFVAQHNEVENWRGGYTHILYNNSSAVNHTGFKIFMGSGGSEVGGFDNYKYALYGVTG